MRHYWAMPFGSRFIWGATAGMLVTLQRISGSGGEVKVKGNSATDGHR